MAHRKRRVTAGGSEGRTPLIFSIGFRVVLIIAAASLVLSYISVYINPTKFSIPMFFGMFFIPIAAINIILFIVALLKRSKSAWIPVVTLLPFLLYAESFFKIGKRETEATEYTSWLKIESYNIGMFNSSKAANGREECKREIAEYLRKERADIVCLQECYVNGIQEIDTMLCSLYPYRHYKLFKTRKGKLFGNLTLSRHKITGEGELVFSGSTNLSLYTDIDYNGTLIRVYNNHLESYNLSFTTLVKKFTSSRNNIGDELQLMHDKMKGTSIKRSEQVNRVLQNISQSEYPAIICGDFNDTPMSYTYNRLSHGRKDTFKECGKNFGATFAPFWPLLRIDYILIPQQWRAVRHTTNRIDFSDHYPVSAEIEIGPE